MKNKSLKRRTLTLLTIFIGLVVLGQVFQASCPKGPEYLDIASPFTIDYLYPTPGAKIPFACHILAFLKSPFTPMNLVNIEDIFKEDGVQALWGSGRDREGVIVAWISDRGALAYVFPVRVPLGPIPPFAASTTLYVDGKKLKIGHIDYKEIGREFIFTTILNPFLWPGKHVGKIVIQLPTGETTEYEWEFEITWW